MGIPVHLLAFVSARFPAALRRAGAALGVLAAVGGCAGLGPHEAVGPDDSIALEVSQAPGWPGAIPVHNESVGNASPEGLVGAGAGAVAGAAWGLACGPLAALCVPLGAVAGADVGLLAGLLVGTTAALPEEKANRLRDRVTRAVQSHDVRGAFEADLADQAKAHWVLGAGAPSVTVDIDLQEVVLASTRDERIRCVVKVAVAVRRHGKDPPVPAKPRVYEYVSPYESLANWLDEDGGVIDTTLASASRNLAAQIVSGLEAKKSPPRDLHPGAP